MSTDQDCSQFWPEQDWIGLYFFWKLADQDGVGLRKLLLYLCDYSKHIKNFVVIRFYRFAKWEFFATNRILPRMGKALLTHFCNSNCVHLSPHISLSSRLYLLSRCSLILHSSFALAQLQEITPLLGMLFMYFFFKWLGSRAMVFNLGAVCLFSVGRENW